MPILSRILGTRGGQETQQAVSPANDLSIQQEEKSLSELRASLEASYNRPDAAGLQEQIGAVADQFDSVQQRLEQKASGDARYAETRKLLESAVNQTDHVQRGSNLIQLMASCDQAMSKSGADQGLLRETKDAAKKMLELGKKEADLAQQEVKARQQSRRVSAKRAQQAASEQKKQAQALKEREKQEEDITKSLNATAADQQAAQASRTKTGAVRIGGDPAGEDYQSAEEKLETTLADANQPAGAGAYGDGREGASFEGRAELQGAELQGAEQSGLEAGVEGSDLAADTEASLDPSVSGDEFFELFDGVRRRRVKKRKPDGSLIGLQEILQEGVGIDQINILDFIQDPVLLKYFDIALNRQLGEIRQRYGEDAIILWTITELARAIIAQGLAEKGLAGAQLPPSLRRPRTPTEEAVSEACKGALFGYIN